MRMSGLCKAIWKSWAARMALSRPVSPLTITHYALAERSATSAARVLEEQAKFPAIGKTHRDQEIKQSARQNLRLNQAQEQRPPRRSGRKEPTPRGLICRACQKCGSRSFGRCVRPN